MMAVGVVIAYAAVAVAYALGVGVAGGAVVRLRLTSWGAVGAA
jgi:hypothetical protein